MCIRDRCNHIQTVLELLECFWTEKEILVQNPLERTTGNLERCSMLLADLFGLHVTVTLTISTFSPMRTVFTLPSIIFCVEAVGLNVLMQIDIV